MIETKKPEVTLFTFTDNPKESIALAVSAWTSDYVHSNVDEMRDDSSIDIDELVEKGLKAFHTTALEYVDTVWVIRNCSRAFQQQLTRTRLATFSIQSLRVVTKGNFAENGNYTMPAGLTDYRQMEYHAHMLQIQNTYNRMIRDGVPVEDARGILPLNIHSDITFRINLNALYHMLKQRLCVNTQWEYRQVAKQIKSEISEKMGDAFSKKIDAPCVHVGKCPMKDEYCGIPIWQYEPELRMDIYEQFVSYKRVDGKWAIKWVKGGKPFYINQDANLVGL